MQLRRARYERRARRVQREIERLQTSGAAAVRRARCIARAQRVNWAAVAYEALSDIGGLILSIEEKYDEVRQLITVGKEKGYLLYDEVNEILPSEITSSEELDDLFNAFGSAGIEVVDSDKAYRGDKDFDRDGSGDEPELDLTPGALDKTNDPVRMYLREMGTVPLLTREGEVAIAKRIERGKLAVIKSISRTPTIAKRILIMGDQLRAGERTIRELVIFSDEEITDEVIEERAVEVLGQIEAVRKARANYSKLDEKLDRRAEEGQEEIPPRAPEDAARPGRGLAPHPQHRVHRDGQAPPDRRGQGRRRRRREGAARSRRLDRSSIPKIKIKGPKLKEEEKKNLLKKQKDLRTAGQADDRRPRGDARAPAPHASKSFSAARRRPSRRRRSWSKPTFVWSSRSRRSTPTAACSSST